MEVARVHRGRGLVVVQRQRHAHRQGLHVLGDVAALAVAVVAEAVDLAVDGEHQGVPLRW